MLFCVFEYFVAKKKQYVYILDFSFITCVRYTWSSDVLNLIHTLVKILPSSYSLTQILTKIVIILTVNFM